MGKRKDKRYMDILNAARRKAREEYLSALADGRKQRANTFRPRKGRGSYKRPQGRNERGQDDR